VGEIGKCIEKTRKKKLLRTRNLGWEDNIKMKIKEMG
jgi:hypothetical protein